MTKYQKIIYKTAKLICKNKDKKVLLSCYKARLKYSKRNKYTFKRIKSEYDEHLKWSEWHKVYQWNWNEEKGHAEWINKLTGILATQKDCDSFWNR